MKRKIPYTLLEPLSMMLTKVQHIITVVPNPDTLISIKDKANDSGFYFQIIKYESKGQDILYTIDFAPTNENNLSKIIQTQNRDGVIRILQEWIRIIDKYNNIEFFDEDPVFFIKPEVF